MEKIAYLYQNDNARYKNVSQSDKNKRITKINNYKQKTETTILEIQKTFGMQTTKNLLDLESQEIDSSRKPLIRDKNTGEYAHTGGMNTNELIQEQRKAIKAQDANLDQLGGIIQNIKYEN